MKQDPGTGTMDSSIRSLADLIRRRMAGAGRLATTVIPAGVLLAAASVLSPVPVRADETCMSPFMPKITGQEDYVYVWTLGVEGLERLCKTYGSADYLEKAMRDWSDDVVRANHPLSDLVPRRLTLHTVFSRHLGRAAGSCSARRQHRHPHRCIGRRTHL